MHGKRNSSGKILRAALGAAATVSIVIPAARGAVWTPTSGTTWNTDANWTPQPAPGSVGFSNNQDTATIDNAGAPRTVTVDASRNIKFIDINVATLGAANEVTLTGGSLLLSAGGALTMNSSTSDPTTSDNIKSTVASPITLQGDGGSYSFVSNKTGSSTRGLVISGSVQGVSTGTNVTALTLGGTSDVATLAQGNSIQGVISNGAGGGTLSVSKTGTGSWMLGGANTYTGATSVSAGILTLGAANSIPSGSAVTVSGGTLALAAFNDAVASFSLQGGTATSTAGVLTIGASAFDIQSGTVSAILGGATTGLNKTTAGTATVSGLNTFGGPVNISNGKLISGNTTSLGNVGNTITLSGGTLNTRSGASAASSQNGYNFAVTSSSTVLSGRGGTGIGAGIILQENTLGIGNATLTVAPDPDINTSTAGMAFSGATTLTGSNVTSTFNPVSNAPNAIPAVFQLASVTGSATPAQTNTLALDGTTAGNIISGVISNGGGGGNVAVTKSGGSTWALSGSNTYSGDTTVSSGTLLANNAAGSATGTGNVLVNGGKFGGTGAVTGSVVVNGGGTLAPGGSIESLAVGGLTLNGDNVSTSVFQYELDTVALNGDLLVDNGALTIDPDATIQFLEGPAGTVAPGSKLTLINYSGVLTGNFLGYADDSTFLLGGNVWQINYNDTTGGSNFSADQTLTNFVTLTAVPEPASAGVLAMAGLIGIGARRRRR